MVEMADCGRRPPLPGFRLTDEMDKDLIGILVQTVGFRHARRLREKGETAVQHRLIQLMIIFQRTVDHADVVRRQHGHHLFVPFLQERPGRFMDGKETGRAAAADAGFIESADVFLPDLQHCLRDLMAVFAVGVALERLRLFRGAAHPDMDLVRRFRDQPGRTVADKETVAVHPGDIIGFGLEHCLGFAAGQGTAEIVERNEPDIAQLGQDGLAFRIEPFGPDDHRFIHAVLAQGGDHQEDAPEIIAVARSHDRVVFHAFSSIRAGSGCGTLAASTSSR